MKLNVQSSKNDLIWRRKSSSSNKTMQNRFGETQWFGPLITDSFAIYWEFKTLWLLPVSQLEKLTCRNLIRLQRWNHLSNKACFMSYPRNLIISQGSKKWGNLGWLLWNLKEKPVFHLKSHQLVGLTSSYSWHNRTILIRHWAKRT